MTSDIIVGLLAFLGTLIGAISASKLVIYRVEQLEKKMDKHNQVVERFVVLEESSKMLWKQIDSIKATLDELRKEIMG